MGRDLESHRQGDQADNKEEVEDKPKINGTTVTSLSVPVKSANGGISDDLFDDDEEDSFISFSASGELATPPDGGWGWVVVFASFMIHIISEYRTKHWLAVSMQ